MGQRHKLVVRRTGGGVTRGPQHDSGGPNALRDGDGLGNGTAGTHDLFKPQRLAEIWIAVACTFLFGDQADPQ